MFSVSSFSLLLLPRLGLWSRDKAAKGIAEVAIEVEGRIDAAASEVEVVGVVGIRVGPGRPVEAGLASVVKLVAAVGIDTAAPHKEEEIENIYDNNLEKKQ